MLTLTDEQTKQAVRIIRKLYSSGWSEGHAIARPEYAPVRSNDGQSLGAECATKLKELGLDIGSPELF